jgi:hypothetical protein
MKFHEKLASYVHVDLLLSVPDFEGFFAVMIF